jgi:nitroreductase
MDHTLSDLLRARHSCRAYKPDPVARKTVEAIIADAQRVPSWCNAQPWQVIVTAPAQTDALRAGLMHHAFKGGHSPDIPFPERYEGAYRDRRRTCGWQLYEAVGVEKGDRAASSRQMMENFRFFGAPHVALITTEAALGPYSLVDIGGFVTGFTLAAKARGLDTIPQAATASFAPFLRTWFDLPESRQIVCTIAFGHGDSDHPANGFRTERAGMDEVLDWRA